MTTALKPAPVLLPLDDGPTTDHPHAVAADDIERCEVSLCCRPIRLPVKVCVSCHCKMCAIHARDAQCPRCAQRRVER